CPARILASLLHGRLGAAVLPVDNPYRSLAAFDVEHAPLFFGREELTDKLHQHFAAMLHSGPRLLAVLGPSGSGKSSVVRAGLVPRLLATAAPGAPPPQIAILRPGKRPLDELARKLAALLPVEPGQLLAQRKLAVLDVLRHRGPQGEADGLLHLAEDLNPE